MLIIKEVVVEPDIEVIHSGKMKKGFKEMYLHNDDKILDSERVFKYKKLKIINKSKSCYDPLFSYGIDGT
jgi:hypothetical protein